MKEVDYITLGAALERADAALYDEKDDGNFEDDYFVLTGGEGSRAVAVKPAIDLVWRVLATGSNVRIRGENGYLDCPSDWLASRDTSDVRGQHVHLVEGRLGTGHFDADLFENEILVRYGPQRTLVVRSGAIDRAIALEQDHARSPGRPSKRIEIKAAYDEIYPDGHKGDHSWKQVRRALNEKLGYYSSEQTIRRAIKPQK
jgi:hypothetical protein